MALLGLAKSHGSPKEWRWHEGEQRGLGIELPSRISRTSWSEVVFDCCVYSDHQMYQRKRMRNSGLPIYFEMMVSSSMVDLDYPAHVARFGNVIQPSLDSRPFFTSRHPQPSCSCIGIAFSRKLIQPSLAFSLLRAALHGF